MSIKKMLTCGMLLLFALSVRSQSYYYPKNEAALRSLRQELQEESQERETRVQRYLQSHLTESRSFQVEDNRYFLHDVVDGHPQYLITHNAGSARSMGMEDLRPGGKFGLNITGAGLRVAVWDAGLARRTHQAYQGRLLNNDSGAEVDDHACHVVGTLIAAGIKPNAQGMLYEAQASAYDWNQDYEEMITESLNNNLLVSNHSYGYGAGWENGVWLGDASISNEEDYRFGFYGSRSRTVDNIAFNAPYYSIFKSAGNDRGDSGNGVQPADGPFDCISDWGVAKNVFTIGAVRKISGEYTGPQDIVMSGFSSWGPADDGRIKPDLVAPGVSLYSALSGSDEAYGNLSGTSMASPSAAGAVMAVNEAHRLFHNTYLRSATLKALIIQTAFEAGNSPGPDYSFGWGMVNASGAVDLISKKDEVNNFIIESSLLNQDSFVLELNPVADKKITATIAWTDPAGSPVSASLDPTDLMLVNDLDMRIRDEVGNVVRPWSLDPSAPGKVASRSDNFRDNVEKIEFNNPQPRKYFLVIKHKGELRNGKQDFGLVLQYQSQDPGLENLYWVNNDGQWSDNEQWSNTSGGNTSSLTPQANSKLIFDNNSFDEVTHTVTIDQDFEVAGIVSLNDKQVTFDLGGNTLTVSGSVIIGSPNFTITNGTIILSNENPDQTYNIDLDQTNTSNLNIVIDDDNAATWTINSSEVSLNALSVLSGTCSVSNTTLKLSDLIVHGDATFNLVNSELVNPSFIQFTSGISWNDDFNSVIRVDDPAVSLSLDAPEITINTKVEISGTSIILSGDGMILDRLETANATISQPDNITIFNLTLLPGSILNLAGGVTLEISKTLVIDSSPDNRVRLASVDVLNKPTILLGQREKYCYTDLEIENLDLAGAASVSVGVNSTVINSDNWFEVECEDLLFANFDVQYTCVGSLAQFTDNSEGEIAAYQWYVNGEPVGTDAITEYVFTQTGDYLIQLEITDPESNVASYEETVTVVTSDIPDNRIIQNPTQLASLNVADSYQWYKNGEPIPGATSRVYVYNGELAIYWVVTYQGLCNKRSEVLDLLGTAVRNLDREGEDLLDIYPIPTRQELYLKARNAPFRQFYLNIYNAYGQSVFSADLGPGTTHKIDLSSYTSGIYFLVMDVGDQILTKKIIKHD
ncbi:S8 family serine peptidase [Flavilitoribacter nigricans]|uniref:PKD domain-containing protein n=1 Tax=Flavilitoribacter nigricans (strain ATCC 23147 / DSM 23189 / NBRC 102662 / NCIMB 1420 / SS-2) TaxID=1122177 RepID=A0A2D0N5M3_FLAN2|nr:S8 family serine peptidase [Flavilitoribacter nigricans]PHN03805.1 hypothetical protein CRP01_24975 [Flavilitoribacter nigricans DSM 23189 = NBRC 102662]